ncbi:MAG: DMT family transporter [Proteobacteria bacterium]|nr:DMT family transporter [Pseudomonadota bacterium]
MNQAGSGRQATAVAGLVAVTAIWGSTFILVKWTVVSVDVYYFLFLRFALAAALMAAVFHRKLARPKPGTLLASLALSLLLFSAYVAQTEGLKITSASNSALISGMYMVMVPFFLMVYPGKKPALFAAAGVTVATPGMFLLTRFAPAGLNAGDLLTLGCAAAFAWHIILTGEFTCRHSVVELVVFQLAFVAAAGGLVWLLRGAPATPLPPVGWLALAVTAILATAFAFTVQTWAQRTVDPTRTGIIFALEAVFGVLFGWLLGGDSFTPLSAAGAFLMIAGMAISESRPLARYAAEKLFS